MKDSANKTPTSPRIQAGLCLCKPQQGVLSGKVPLLLPRGGLNIHFPTEGWFQPTKPQQEAHVVAVFTDTSSFVAAICTLQGYSEHNHILASRQKFPVPGSICMERQSICYASSWLKQVMVAFTLLTMLWRAAGRGEDKARTTENLFTSMHAIGELHLLQIGKAIMLPFISGRVSTRALVPGLMAPGWQLLLPCPSFNYHLL